MTCREKYVLDNAVKFAEGITPPGCPDDYGYLKRNDVADENGYCICSCESCWNREIPQIDEDKVEFIRRIKRAKIEFLKDEKERATKETELEIEKLTAAITKLTTELNADGKD